MTDFFGETETDEFAIYPGEFSWEFTTEEETTKKETTKEETTKEKTTTKIYFREIPWEYGIYGEEVCVKLEKISKWWKNYLTGLHSDSDIITQNRLVESRTVTDEKLTYVCKLLETIKDIKHLAHDAINEYILKFSEEQLRCFLDEFEKLSEDDKKNHNIQIYLCVFILYPEIGIYLNLTDSYYTMSYNNCMIRRFISNYLTKDELFEFIKIGKTVVYDIDFVEYYLTVSPEEKIKINEFSEILLKFIPLCRGCCCGRGPSGITEYWKILLDTSEEKRTKIAEYIIKANYASLFIIKEMAEYFDTLTFEEMEIHFIRAKTAWPDIHIDYTHRFEKLFMYLLKLDNDPTEEEIVKFALTDSSSRQDIDICYWNCSPDEIINKETCERLGIEYEPIEEY